MGRPDVRSQLREAVLCLDKRDLQTHGVNCAQQLLRRAGPEDLKELKPFFQLCFSLLQDRSPTARRLRYR